MALPEHIQTIVDKVEEGEDLTEREELTYFTEILGYSPEEAKKMLHIVDQRVPGRFID